MSTECACETGQAPVLPCHPPGARRAVVLGWMKPAGVYVTKGELLAVLLTEDGTAEVRSGYSGMLSELLVRPGAITMERQPLAYIGYRRRFTRRRGKIRSVQWNVG